ncbi:tRNA pseudouridine55 synthase [Novosphingobium sp. 1529]|uniref:tRNA pseudouridine(55) synthase TruB n=1 Tax=Novosphingobium sp. 1529 TaxID=3156424 RepID=UPI00339632D9
MADGWIILDKPLTLGSTQGVAAVKRNLRARGLGKCKVGHGGTLDPLATGVLPIAVGEATKLCGRMLDAHKTYAFTVAFGAETDTLDLEGAVIGHSTVRPTRAALDAALAAFTGPIAQVPPAYSALKVDGERAYDLARAGHDVVLAARNVTIHALRVLETQGSDAALDSATLEADVSKGTYIRSLARDIALALGTRGHVTMLRRLKAGPFTLEQAISLDKLNDWGQGAPLENVILPVEAGLVDIPALDLNPEQAGAVRQGRVLSGLPFPDGLWWARCGGKPVALVMLAGGALRVERGFNL